MFSPNFLLEASDHAETRKKKDCVFVTPVQPGFCMRLRKAQSIHTQKAAGVGGAWGNAVHASAASVSSGQHALSRFGGFL